MMLVVNLATSNAIAPPSKARNTKSVRKSSTMVQRFLLMMAGGTDWVLEPVLLYTQPNVVNKGELCDCKWITRSLIAFTAQM